MNNEGALVLRQMRNKRGNEVLIVVRRSWAEENVIDLFARKGIDLTGFYTVRSIALFEGDLDVKLGDWWAR